MIKGAKFSSLCANIKYKDRLDLTLILLEAASIVTGVFTNSKTKAPSVIWSKKVVKSASKNEEEPIAIVINSGNANAFTGKEGTQAIEKVVSEIAENLKISKKRISCSHELTDISRKYKNLTDKGPDSTYWRKHCYTEFYGPLFADIFSTHLSFSDFFF